ncbi:hypothetical protein I7I53_03530 [Histoplasma capsulatum var. duboisii H88]|uniref:Uncharacterized protein n=1 Tax=Ajellomyces capsulatus (strain H88) TaxID=544711 RepID=A0A8A1LUH7_AJEC8|nr:hypothetical protein I7I53_03530 [Histoplasma capsulatum var. duboisii H88]
MLWTFGHRPSCPENMVNVSSVHPLIQVEAHQSPSSEMAALSFPFTQRGGLAGENIVSQQPKFTLAG